MRPHRESLDDDSASRLLQGTVHPDDAPPGYASVAALLRIAAQTPQGPVDEDIAAVTVTAMVELIREAGPTPQTSRRKSMLSKLLAGKAIAAIAVVGLTASGAAAATGSLPDPAQSVVSGALSHVGVDVPNPNHGKSADHRQDATHDEAGDDQGEAGDEVEPTTETTGMSTFVHEHQDDEGKLGPVVCAEASDGKCHAGEHGKPGSSEDDSTPPSSAGENHRRGPGSGDQSDDSSDDSDEVTDATTATTATTGSVETGDDHSGDSGDSGGSSGRGKSDSDE